MEPSNLRFPEPDDVFQLRVSLVGVKPEIWRRLRVPKTIRLARLHSVLQLTMGWTNSHLHQFRVGDVLFGEPDPDLPDSNTIDYRTIELRHIAPRRGARCVYEYDFGDGWEHLVDVEDELAAHAAGTPVLRCLDGRRACPPEDCGGPYGYRELLTRLRRRAARKRDRKAARADEVFDPEAFDIDAVNARLADRTQRTPTPSRRHLQG